MRSELYSRYVALGDSQTEGLWDGDDDAGVVGYADRLAGRLGALNPDLQYANLAVRGRVLADVLQTQLPHALSMQPDLITVCAGMNDTIRPGRAFDRALLDLDLLYRRLADSGATVVTTTFPDIAQLLPVGRLLSKRLTRINSAIRAAAADYGIALVDLYNADSMLDVATWSPDRMHASSLGHRLFAEAAAEALGLPDSSDAWARCTRPGAPAPRSAADRSLAQWQWTRNMLVPWLWRHLRGRSGGDGRSPKRPHLAPLS